MADYKLSNIVDVRRKLENSSKHGVEISVRQIVVIDYIKSKKC